VSDTITKAKAEALDNENLLKISPEPLEPDQLYMNSCGELSDTLDSDGMTVSSFSLTKGPQISFFQMENSTSTHQVTALKIVDPLQGDDEEEQSPDVGMGILTEVGMGGADGDSR